jgi:ABC-type sugar transport system ATPase subunit
MVFQSYALYPHMTVGDNIAFPLRMVGTPRSEIERAVRDAATRLRIDHLLDRRPGQLSGGQQQRCALARAIVRKPRLFLLDEPLSNLDAKLRLETRVELRKLQRALGVTAVYVTHDQEEAMTIADRMAVFMDGQIVQVGIPEEVFAVPNCVDVATFLGNPPMNLLRARVHGHALELGGHKVWLPRDLGGPREVILGLRPPAIRLGGDGVPALVYLTEQLGDGVIVDLHLNGVLVRARLGDKPAFSEGAAVGISFDPAEAHLFDPETGRRLA